MEPTRYRFGEKIREIRERRHLTLKEVADRAGLSESLISQIERNKIVPAIDTLLAIVDILEIDLEYLFRDFKQNRPVRLIRKSDRQKIVIQKASYERLSSTLATDEKHGLEAYFLEIEPGGEKGTMEYGHPGQELGVIIEGTGELAIGKHTYPLLEGDSLSFASDAPHILRNVGKTKLRAFWVTTPPKGFPNN